MQNHKNKYLFFFFTLVLISLFIYDIINGDVSIPFNEVVSFIFNGGDSESRWSIIIRDFRLPKVFTAVIAGSALAVSGLQMQAIFRNPLAGPYVLGISSGASLGVAIVVMGGAIFVPASSISSSISNVSIVIAACLGAGLLLLAILSVSAKVKYIMTILILGILFGAVTSSIVSILQYFSTEADLKSFIIWTMGDLGGVSTDQVVILTIVVSIGLILSTVTLKQLNALLLGEQYAITMGVNLKATRALIFVSTSLLAGGVAAFCGPLGFIGVAVPHIARLTFKTSDHRILLPASALLGSITMLISDIITRIPAEGAVLPINAVTSLIGIPIIMWLIIGKRKITTV